MLKTRVVPTVLLKDAVVVQTVQFSRYRPIGIPRQPVRVYNMRDVDELVILDIDPRVREQGPRFSLLRDLADECFMPLAVGGGVRELDVVRRLLGEVADKIIINTAAVERPRFVEECAATFGSQCVVVSIDAKKNDHGEYEVFTRGGRQPAGMDPVSWATQVESKGAGEILLTSIERDGTMQGYDLDLVRSVASAVSVPVIASGGAGKAEDFLDVIRTGGASAVAAGSIFQFTQITPNDIKQHLYAAGVETRLTGAPRAA